jgi:hypothetical protein
MRGQRIAKHNSRGGNMSVIATPEASRETARPTGKNGTKSKGPKIPEGKTRSAQNALKHGRRAQKHVLLSESAAAFAEGEAALLADLAPEGSLRAGLWPTVMTRILPSNRIWR